MRMELATLQNKKADLSRRSSYRSQVSARIHAEIRPLEECIRAIQNHPSGRKSLLHAFFSASPYTNEAQQNIEPLQNAIKTKLATIPEDVDSAIRSVDFEISVLTPSIADYEKALLPHLKREERLKEAKQKKELQKQRMAELRAAAASANGATRELAAKLRRRMAKQGCCPYCGGQLGDIPHADHIYPVSKGGRSVERNLVFACAPCNIKKSKLTLTAFIKLYSLNRDIIEARLTAMGKDF